MLPEADVLVSAQVLGAACKLVLAPPIPVLGVRVVACGLSLGLLIWLGGSGLQFPCFLVPKLCSEARRSIIIPVFFPWSVCLWSISFCFLVLGLALALTVKPSLETCRVGPCAVFTLINLRCSKFVILAVAHLCT